jgi:RNA-directed DNA polymerase
MPTSRDLPADRLAVFCKDATRRREAEHTSFDFLGYTLRARLAKGRNGYFASFSPAISGKARKAVGQKIRAWHLNPSQRVGPHRHR